MAHGGIKKRLMAAVSAAAMVVTVTMSTASNVQVNADSAELTYGDELKLSLYFYDANQCGSEVDDNTLTWRGNCHVYDSTASLSSAVGLGDSEKQFIKNANGGSDTVDVSGGYHDAGDHVKPAMTMGFSCTSLAWSYYAYPDAYINTGSKDHLFDILKNTCDYLMKVTYLDESDNVVTFCYIVSDEQSDHNLWQTPESQTYERKTYWATASHQSADAAGEMAAALASSSIALREVDSEYADECLKYAKALRDFAVKYPGSSTEGVANMYESSATQDDIAWGDLWCHIADGTLSEYTPLPVNSDGSYHTSSGNQYDGWIYSWDKVWGGYSALLYSLGYSDYGRVVSGNADRFLSNPVAGQYYIIGSNWGSSRHSCAWQMYCLTYAKASGQSAYAEKAKTQMDYLLGGNPDSRSYLIGYGDNYPKQIHHRAANPYMGNAKYVLYGALIGGPTDNNGSFNDYYDAYDCTEPALDYNGNFALAIAGLCDVYGSGDGSGADKIIEAASEINSDYEFGSWYSNTPIEPVTTTTATETTTSTETTTETTSTTTSTNTSTTTSSTSTSTTTETTTTTAPVDETLIGDINDDKKVNIADAVLLQEYLLGKTQFTKEEWERADILSDERVDVFDMVMMRKQLIQQ